MDQTAVPKFGSFKPKSASKPTPREDESQNRSKREEHSRKHQGRHDEDRRRHRHDRRESRERTSRQELSHRKRSQEARAKTPDELPIATDEFEESSLFIVDRRGDSKNVEYGSLHRYSIPAYRRVGYGKVLGLAGSTKIDRDDSSDKEIRLTTLDHRQRKPRLLTSKHGRGNESKLRFVLFTSDNNDSTESDYIDLRPSRKRKRGSESPEPAAFTVDYRSIEGKAKTSSQPADEDLEIDSDSEGEDTDLDLHIRQQSAVLSKAAKTNPNDLNAWLALSDHQAKLVRAGALAVSLSSSERRTLADLRLSILNEACTHITKGTTYRERLLRAIIDEGTIVWDSAKRASRWIEALAECPGSIMLWTDYLNYVQDSHSGFKFEDCKDAFTQCLRMLKVAGEKEGTSTSDIQVYVLLRLTAFIRDAGYDELSIALWQAVLEYHLRMPPQLREASLSDRLASFEDFWESETPRIGENDSKGWMHYEETNESTTRTPANAQQRPIDRKRPFVSFAETETALQGFILPASTEDDDATSDPFRCVMFSDISEILDLVSSELPTKTLISAALCFFGLPCIASTDEASPKMAWSQDPHLGSGWTTYAAVDGVLNTSVGNLQCRRETTDSLFDDAFDDFARRFDTSADDPRGLIDFVDRILEAIVAVVPQDDDIAEYFLAYKLQLSPVEAGKTAKRLLKQRPSSLRLYNAYALIEAKRGNLDKAQSVWTTALGADLGSAARDGDVVLWHSRLLAQCKNESAARHVVAEDDAGSHVKRLRARRLLKERLDRALLARNHLHGALLVDCLAWMEYLANGRDMDRTLQVFHTQASRFKRSGLTAAVELIEEYQAGLLKLHVDRQRPFKPAALKFQLEEALKLFPSNSSLLELHSSIVAQDRLRSLVRNQQVTHSADLSIVQWSFKIAEELRRLGDEAFGSNPNTVRATFSKALLSADSAVNHSLFLWMMWLRFEHGQTHRLEGTRKREAAQRTKQVYLDGLRSLPWVKQWVITGMKFLCDGTLSQGELRQSYETLVERGIRLRVDIEDMI
ncbi:hypothetical protein M409DRAFT_69762 [Zasmidium cellare ATCC 36951]|uniref:DUF1740-domain-containing protein n=1 Tax=Zasmidium cellare ATCC 36951 TaxID=1080233 RepID=A0A6A6C3B7_ZASCE|nr:uncharacterized protein M409DRAFT_69762 [Zasmidium cellare ATCC 36951]KAF2161403.1 hypothetical protein M409DRAFT_69762 [Zasmidium cellare ATCC 36951]